MNNLMDLGGGVGWIMTIVIGGLAGWIAEKITRSDMGILMNIVFGVLGSILGGMLANLIGFGGVPYLNGWFFSNLIISVIGAVILIMVLKLFRQRQGA